MSSVFAEALTVAHVRDDRTRPCERRLFPGWRWVAVGLAFPIAGWIAWKAGGRVDAPGAALVGGALTGVGLGAVQWWAAVFGAAGSVTFMLLSGLVLARFAAARPPAA